MSTDTLIAELSAAKATLAQRELDVTAAESALTSTKALRDAAQDLVDAAEAALLKAV